MISPGGREPATRGVFALEAQELLLPNPMALDTSFVVEALIALQIQASRSATQGLKISKSSKGRFQSTQVYRSW
jgi:hypothetical protein